jgi:hypothetical protein
MTGRKSMHTKSAICDRCGSVVEKTVPTGGAGLKHFLKRRKAGVPFFCSKACYEKEVPNG